MKLGIHTCCRWKDDNSLLRLGKIDTVLDGLNQFIFLAVFNDGDLSSLLVSSCI